MINIDFLNINNSKLIGRLVPFWLRGKKVTLLLLSMLHPIVSLHNNFKAKALEYYIIAHITAQQKSIEWYLNYKLKQHFHNKDDTFQIIYGIDSPENILFYNKEEHQADAYTAPIYYKTEADKDSEMVIYYNGEIDEETNVAYIHSPRIVETISYDRADYERDIRTIIDRFLTNFRKYNIILEE